MKLFSSRFLFVWMTLLLLQAIACSKPDNSWHADPKISYLTSNYVFIYENWMQPRVWTLRRQEKLDDVIQNLSQNRKIFEALTLWAKTPI